MSSIHNKHYKLTPRNEACVGILIDYQGPFILKRNVPGIFNNEALPIDSDREYDVYVLISHEPKLMGFGGKIIREWGKTCPAFLQTSRLQPYEKTIRYAIPHHNSHLALLPAALIAIRKRIHQAFNKT